MPVYRFQGRHYETGGVVAGERFASSKQSLASLLRREKIMPVTITERGRRLAWKMPGQGVSSKDLALFTRQFSVMLNAGLPLVQCLGIMAEQQSNKHFSGILRQILEEVEAGGTLAEAMRKHPKIFDTLFVNMVGAGETGGILDSILDRLCLFQEKNVKLKRSLLSASVYPAIIIVVAVVIVFVILLWVIPVFATLFESLNAPLPLATRLVMRSSALLSQFALPLVVGVVLLALSFRYYQQTEQGRLQTDRVLLRLPLLGPVVKKIVIARFSRTLATLLASGIPILEGLEITAGTAGNQEIQQALLKARREVEEGKALTEPLKKISVFPPMVTQLLAVGEQTGELDQMLQKLADYYEEEADAAVSNFLTLIEPLMIVFLGVVVGGIVISMYWPIFTLIGRLAAM